MEEKKEKAVPKEISTYQWEALELLNHFCPDLMRPRDYTLLGIYRYYLNAGDWETPLGDGLTFGDPMAAEYIGKIAGEQGNQRRAREYQLYAEWLRTEWIPSKKAKGERPAVECE